MILTHLNTIVFLYQRNHPEDGQIAVQNMLVKKLQQKYINKIKVHLLVINERYTSNKYMEYGK